MQQRQRFSMPDDDDRTDLAALATRGDETIDYGDIPPLADASNDATDLLEADMLAVRHRFASIAGMEPVTLHSLPRDMPEQGVYAFFEAGRCLYVGRSNRLRKRLRDHVAVQPEKAAFAFRLARKETGRTATYRAGEGRSALFADPAFRRVFDDQVERIMAMGIRYAEERDPLRQTLLEIYCIRAFAASENDFETH